MTPDEFLKDMDTCYGPCGKLCLYCPEAHYMAEIVQMVKDLVKERDELLGRKQTNIDSH